MHLVAAPAAYRSNTAYLTHSLRRGACRCFNSAGSKDQQTTDNLPHSPLCFMRDFRIDQSKCWVRTTHPPSPPPSRRHLSAFLQPCTYCTIR